MGADQLAKTELSRLRGARELPLLKERGGQRSRGKKLFQSVPTRDAQCPRLPAQGLPKSRKRAGQNVRRPKNYLRLQPPSAMSEPRRHTTSRPPDYTLFHVHH